jgi:hypothetical protein
VHNDSKQVQDVVISLLSIKGDSNFTLCRSDRVDNRLLMLCEVG